MAREMKTPLAAKRTHVLRRKRLVVCRSLTTNHQPLFLDLELGVHAVILALAVPGGPAGRGARAFAPWSLGRPPELSVRSLFAVPVCLSLADTLGMPLAARSKVTSICGRPRGDGASPSRGNRASWRWSRAIGRSPW